MKHFLTNFLRMGSAVSTPPIRSAMRSSLLLLGLILSVSMWGAVTGNVASSIAAGDQVILINTGENAELTGVSSNIGQQSSYSNSKPSGTCILTVEDGKYGTGNYSFRMSDGQYLAYTSSATKKNNNLWAVTLEASPTDDQKMQVTWSITFNSNNEVTINNVYNTGRKLSYNSQSGQERFCCYTTEQTAVKFFKLSGSQQSTVSVEQVTLNKDGLTLTVDDEETLTATVSPDNASNKNVTWASSDETVATVSNAGLVTAVGAGDATITCKSVADNTKQATCAVHVNASPYTKSTLIFTAACGGSGTADDAAVWTVTSDGEESNYDGTSGIHYGTNSKSVTFLQLATSDIEGTVARVVVNARDAQAKATISVTVGGDDFTCADPAATNTSSDFSFTGSGSGEIIVRVDRGSSMTKALYVKSIVVYYIAAPQKDPAGLAYDDEDLSNLVKFGGDFTAPTLTNPHNLTVAYESSNTDVAEVAADGALTIKAVGVAEITASSAETETYKAGSAKYTIYVVAHDGTEADPYTVADARVVIDKVGETGIADQYVAGIVSEIVTAYNSQYGNISYNISDDGTTTAAQLQAFRGKGINGENFTSEDDVMVGDEVVVKGLLKKYNNIYEFNADNQLVSLNRTKTAAGLAYAETAVEKNIGDAAFTNALTNPNNLEVSYSSSATGVATVDENGEVTIVGMGTTTIKATFAGNASYLADEVSYTLTVNDPSLIKVTFDATVDKASDNAEGITKNGVNIKASHVDGVNNSSNPITYYQCFKNEVFTATCTSGNIKRIEFSCTSSNPASGFGESYADGVWTGDAAIVEITATVKQVQMNTVTVYYKVDARAEAGLAYETTAIDKHVGDDAFVNTLTNPNNLTVAYESSNTEVAEVAANGTVTIKAEGATTITASFDGDADYKPASVSYELTVNEAGLDNVTFNSSIDLAASGETTISKGGFTLAFTAGTMDGTYAEYRLHKNGTMTLSSTDYKIKKIEFTCASGNPVTGFGDATGLDKTNSRWTGEANKVELTASNAQVRITQMIVYYVEDTRAASGLAWSTDEVEITLGDDFTAASLVNPNNIDAAEISIESSNEDLATVNAGAVELEENVTGEATITATFAGNETYKPAEFSYTIKVNDPTPMIITNPTTYLNFGSKAQGATIDAKNLEVTLQNVATATVAITGDGAAAFSATPMALTGSGTIIVSASSDNQGTFSATLTISDDANSAESKEISLSLTVTEPVVEETAVSTTSQWVAATDANLVDGAEVLITGVKEGATYAMGAQNSNNRAAVVASVDGEGVLAPGEGTMSFTLVAQGDGTFALRASNGKYLYAASSSKNYLRSQDDVDANAKWTLTATSASANTSENNHVMQFNAGSSSNDPLFSCYNSESQKKIAFYVPYYGSYERTGLTAGNYGTICLPQAGTIEGAMLFDIEYYDGVNTMYLLAVNGNAMDAGKPYIFQATSNQLNVTYTSSTQEAASEANGLHGFYNLADENATLPLADDATLGNYILYQNQYWLVSGRAAYINNFRAYIKLGEISKVAQTPVPGAAPRRRVAMGVNGANTATGIDELNASETPVKVMINGQLFIIRGEKMYNANGQLVK